MASTLRFIIVLLGLLPILPAHADQLAPDRLVAKVTAEVLEAIRQDKALQSGDRERALALAEEKVLPYVDFERMTQLAVGRPWRTASPAQQRSLAREFRALLVRTYSNALDAYRGQTMEVQPLSIAPDATDVRVRNRYLAPGRPPVPIDYQMWKSPEGWKIYDIVVDGISLVATYRTQFNDIIQTSGIDGLLASLTERNRRAAPSAPV